MDDGHEVMGFPEAIALARRPRHVLLGNGFSIACRPATFQYGALLDSADFRKLAVDGRQLFELLGTADFEEVISKLQAAANVLRLYRSDLEDVVETLDSDAELVKAALAEVLASRHPDSPAEIEDDEFTHAISFLANFERLYTLNYDLLLYWIVMHDTAGRLPRDDGFRADPDDPGGEYVTWETASTYHNQRVFYLHGALHLFDSGVRLEKYTWSRTGVRLVDQIRASLGRNAFPLVVTEGTSSGKLVKILHNAYLNHARRSFAHITGSLFVFGHSLAANDNHILDLIPAGRVGELWVSVRGDPDDPHNCQMMARAASLAADRRGGPLAVKFFDADSARVWR